MLSVEPRIEGVPDHDATPIAGLGRGNKGRYQEFGRLTDRLCLPGCFLMSPKAQTSGRSTDDPSLSQSEDAVLHM
jgi:hypothetical protein